MSAFLSLRGALHGAFAARTFRPRPIRRQVRNSHLRSLASALDALRRIENREAAMLRYGQFCPVAKAAEIFADRWTPLIVRELCFGPSTFGDLLAAMPLISRTMLAQRLKEMADAGS
jgi:HxlR-like helix-turn-helix